MLSEAKAILATVNRKERGAYRLLDAVTLGEGVFLTML